MRKVDPRVVDAFCDGLLKVLDEVAEERFSPKLHERYKKMRQELDERYKNPSEYPARDSEQGE